MNFKYSFLLIVLIMVKSSEAADLYVATDGRDENSGTLEQPLATLQKASGMMKPGDTCFVRGGLYAEPLDITDLKGTEKKPITFRNYQVEMVVLNGTRILDVSWKKWKNGIYRAQLDYDVWQLFSGSRLVDVARWPNASVNDGSVWDVHKAMRSTDRKWNNRKGSSSSITKDGVIFDKNHSDSHDGVNTQTLEETGVDFTGALAVLNIGHWLTWTRPILSHEAGSNQFTYDSKGTSMKKFLEYYILGLPALDRENEWWYDKASRIIYFKPPPGKHPSQLSLRGKVRDYNLKAQKCEHINFIGFMFFSTAFAINGCHDILIEDCRLLYPSTHKFMLGKLKWVGRSGSEAGNVMAYVYNNGRGPFNNIVRNCRIEYPNSPAIGLNSPGVLLENCFIHDIEWDVNSSGGSGALPGGPHVTIRNCTVHTTGGSEGIRMGSHSTIEGVHIYNTSLLQHDGSAINIGTGSQPGTVTRRNWVHDTNRQAMRFDSTGSAFGTDACVMGNVFFKVEENNRGGNKFKGDYQLVANNTAFDCFVAIPKGYGGTELHNKHSLVRNNLADYLIEWNLSNRVEGIPAKMDHNVRGEGSVRRVLRDPDNLDFRPRASAVELIDAGMTITRAELLGKAIRLPEQSWIGSAPDIGAYEYGDPHYWIPGAKLQSASTPVPPNGATNVKQNASLMWLEGYKATGHNLYLGNSKENVKLAKNRQNLMGSFLKGGAKRAIGMQSNIYDPGLFETGATYFWRVDAIQVDGSIRKGDVWKFQTE